MNARSSAVEDVVAGATHDGDAFGSGDEVSKPTGLLRALPMGSASQMTARLARP